MAPKGHQPQHRTDHHITAQAKPKRSTTKVKKNAAAAQGSGMPMKGGMGMDPKHC